MRKLKSAFISYSDDGSIKAQQVSDYLEPMGVKTYRYEKDEDNKDKHPNKKIKNKIRTHEAIIMVLSAQSRESQWVSHELGIASGMNKTIFVIKTTHNLKLPDYIDEFKVIMLDKLEDLDNYFEKKSN
jgi:hypothetical protein